MVGIVKEALSKGLEESPLQSLLWIKGQRDMVEEASVLVGSWMVTWFSMDLLVYELPSSGEEARDTCKHV